MVLNVCRINKAHATYPWTNQDIPITCTCIEDSIHRTTGHHVSVMWLRHVINIHMIGVLLPFPQIKIVPVVLMLLWLLTPVNPIKKGNNLTKFGKPEMDPRNKDFEILHWHEGHNDYVVQAESVTRSTNEEVGYDLRQFLFADHDNSAFSSILSLV